MPTPLILAVVGLGALLLLLAVWIMFEEEKHNG